MPVIDLVFLRFACILLIVALFTPSCKRDRPEDNCKNSNPVSADFIIEETSDFCDVHVKSQIVQDLSFVKFTAKQDLEYYEWRTGANKFNTKSFKLRGFPAGQTVSVTLIGYRTPDNNCFPLDDGWDTVTKYITTLNKNHNFYEPEYESLITGSYQGYLLSAPNDTFTFTYGFYDILHFSDTVTFDYIENIPVKGKNSKSFKGDISLYKGGSFICFDRTDEYGIVGTAITQDSGKTVRLEYEYWTPDLKNRAKDVFIGTKK